MKKIKAFHILNHGEKKGALKIAKSIKKSSALKIGYGNYGEGSYAHYYKNINKKAFVNVPMVIFEIDSKKIRNEKLFNFDFIVIEGEDMTPIEILEFRNVQGIK